MSTSERPTPDTTGRAGLVIAMLGLAITLSGGLLSWFSNFQSTAQAREAACIARLDQQELQIRDKANDLLGAIGAFGGVSLSNNLTETELHESGAKVIEAAFRFMAYTPPELGLSVSKLLLTMHNGLTAETQHEKETAVAMASVALKEWPERYMAVMSGYEELRKAC